MEHTRTRAPKRPKTGWATTALFATVALALAAGCGSRLEDAELEAANGVGGNGGSSSGSTGDFSTSGTGDFSTSGTGDFSTSGTGDFSTSGTGDVSTSGTGDPGTTGPTNPGTTGPTNPGTTGPTNPGTTGPTNPGSGNPGSGNPGSGNPGSGNPGSGNPGSGNPGSGNPAPNQSVVPAILGGPVSACKPATKSKVTIGNVSTLSGVLGELFSPVVPALNLFVKSQNACGGLNGHPMELLLADDQGDPATAVTQVSRLISEDILAFVGNIQVLTVDAIVGVINEAKIPVVGSDITNNTWYTNPFFFPQGAPSQAVSFGYIDIAKRVVGKTKIGNIYCLEVPVACLGINDAFKALGPKLGVDITLTKQVSITAPSYTSQCLQFRDAGTQVLAMTFDAASQGRLAASCAGLSPPYRPQYIAYPLGVGNEDQFFAGGPNLGGTLVPLTTFGWMPGVDRQSAKYFQAMIDRYGFAGANGNAASLGWTAGALLVAASGQLGDDPTTEQLLKGLYSIKSNNLAGLSPSELTFTKVSEGGPAGTVKYCYYTVQSNKANTAWQDPKSQRTCTDIRSSTDPNQ